jgi:hypothetical protein
MQSRSYVREFGIGVLNLILAIFGTAVVEKPICGIWRADTVRQVVLKEDVLSVVIALALGCSIYRRWRPQPGKWIGVVGVFWFLFGVVIRGHAGGMSGGGCDVGLDAIGCRNWFVFTIPTIRTVSYSCGCWLSWRLSSDGRSFIEEKAGGKARIISWARLPAP